MWKNYKLQSWIIFPAINVMRISLKHIFFYIAVALVDSSLQMQRHIVTSVTSLAYKILTIVIYYFYFYFLFTTTPVRVYGWEWFAVVSYPSEACSSRVRASWPAKRLPSVCKITSAGVSRNEFVQRLCILPPIVRVITSANEFPSRASLVVDVPFIEKNIMIIKTKIEIAASARELPSAIYSQNWLSRELAFSARFNDRKSRYASIITSMINDDISFRRLRRTSSFVYISSCAIFPHCREMIFFFFKII